MDYHLYTSSAAKATDTDPTHSSFIGEERLSQLARESKFQQRDRGKITPSLFVETIAKAAFQQASSFRHLAVLGGTQIKDTIAKQSFWERVDSRAVKFLGSVLCEQITTGHTLPGSIHELINRALVHDSSILKLHPQLQDAFPGSRNQNKVAQSSARIQVVADLLSGEFLQFGISGFTRNDQAASHDILPIVQPRDLVLRDLGYFTLDSLEAIARKKAFFISRLRYGTALFDDHDERINLLTCLRQAPREMRDCFVIEARMGAKKKLPVRIVAVRLPESVANERRRKARADRDKRISHDKAYYELLGWTLLVTNLPEEAVNDLDLTKLYALRWRIENIFKAWKSGLKPGHLSAHKSNKWHIHCLLLGQMLALSRLSRIGVFTIAGDSEQQVSHDTMNHSEISLFKAMDVLLLCDPAMNQTMLQREVIEQILYHGRYEKRKREPLPKSLANLA